jgi:phosphoglycerate kinase
MRSDRPRLLRDRAIRPGERWIYSAGFNVRPDLRDTGRLDSELSDLRRILDGGGRLAVLSHHGSHADGTAGSLAFAADYLAERLGVPVDYVPDNTSTAAVRRSHALRPGAAAVFGNTRQHAGEERGDPDLARQFAELGDVVAVGGFAKAHRAHASNVGILRHLPGYLADSVAAELELLAPWAGSSPRYSLAVLGGVKREKTVVGLPEFAAVYDVVVPGGAVLHHLLRALGHEIGSSALGADPAGCLAVARDVLARPRRARIHIPDHVVVARADGGDPMAIPVAGGVPDGWAIVDFVPQPWLHDCLNRLARGGRAFIAGTPCRYAEGHTGSADTLLRALAGPHIEALLLGGDTVAELPWHGPASTGGGSALHYLAHGTCPVLDAVSTSPQENRS